MSSKWIDEIFDVLPDGDYDSDEIMEILDRVNDLLLLAMRETDDEGVYDAIRREILGRDF